MDDAEGFEAELGVEIEDATDDLFCTAGSRTTPFLPTLSRPASNCGLISATPLPVLLEDAVRSRQDLREQK